MSGPRRGRGAWLAILVVAAAFEAGFAERLRAEEPTDQDDEVEEAQLLTALERALIQRGGLLLPPWRIEIGLDLTYTQSTRETLVTDDAGVTVTERVQRDALDPEVTVRLGLPWRLQVAATVPFRYERVRTLIADGAEETRDRFGLGDVDVEVSAHLLRERGLVPDLLASARWKSTTGEGPFEVGPDEIPLGTGFDAIETTLTAVRSRDPVVFIADLTYTVNLSTATPLGRLDPGDEIGYALGLVLALNPETSLDLTFEQRFARHTTLAGDSVPGSSVSTGVVSLGTSYVLARNVSLDLSVGFGVTADSPDVQVTLAIPVRFPAR
ncbi:MAG TPA: transporter [Thermodesulfobacteriota bacterium]